MSSVRIPETVSRIGDYAFADCTALTSIEIPANVKNICRADDYYPFGENSPFYHCTSLRTVIFHEGLETIGPYTFSTCTALTSVNLPKSLTSLGQGAFYSCSSLRSVTIQDGLASIPRETFSNCGRLSSVSIPASVTSIDLGAFSLEETGLPSSSLVFYGETGSYAEAYAGYYGIPFRTGTAPDSGDTPAPKPTPGGGGGGGNGSGSVPDEEPSPSPTPEPTPAPTVQQEAIPGGGTRTTTTWEDGSQAMKVKTPASGVSFTVTAPGGDAKADFDLPAQPPAGMDFGDVGEEAWYKSAVDTVSGLGLLKGTGKDDFSPNQPVSRGMLAAVLYRLCGEVSYGTGTDSFSDISAEEYYADAADWASAAGIAQGMGGGRFSPGQAVTREQLVSMLYRCALMLGEPGDGPATLFGYADYEQVDGYADLPMGWAVGAGILTGKEGRLLDPKGKATRAETAAILERFLKYLKK